MFSTERIEKILKELFELAVQLFDIWNLNINKDTFNIEFFL